ncbi:hypothetical protein FGO68_gene3457 [Halteria grandinella]|uniref:TLDc domain-containing protein n=1 Tax=Halteria grandinella TaxID=5974 RepID=A0A8J8T0J6_HALGN|nr:hypothetical protein FGO68_gene3457 [Halteria grandinella]
MEPASAQSLRCFVCKMEFDLAKRKPILTLCCQEVCCMDCWKASTDQYQKCPLKCKDTQTNPQESPKTLMHLMRAIRDKEQPSYVRCSLHPYEYCNQIEPFKKQLLCPKCEKSEDEEYEKFAREQVVKSAQSMTTWTIQIKKELENIETTLKNVINNKEPKSKDFLKMSEKILYWKAWNGNKINGYYQYHDRAINDVGNSTLLNLNYDKDYDLIKKGLKGKDFMLKLRFKASRDGFLSSVFQDKMNGCPKYLLVVKSAQQDKIFGAYGSKPFKKGEKICQLDIDAAVFSFTKETVHFAYQNGDHCHNLHPNWIQINNDICLANECHNNQNSYTDFGYTFEPTGQIDSEAKRANNIQQGLTSSK